MKSFLLFAVLTFSYLLSFSQYPNVMITDEGVSRRAELNLLFPSNCKRWKSSVGSLVAGILNFNLCSIHSPPDIRYIGQDKRNGYGHVCHDRQRVGA